MKINELVKEAYQNAKEKGWHDKEREPLEVHALIHSEISKATEEVRQDNPPAYHLIKDESFETVPVFEVVEPHHDNWDDCQKPNGEAIELADAVIRIADYFGERGWDLEEAIQLKMQYNKTRDYRHGNKKF